MIPVQVGSRTLGPGRPLLIVPLSGTGPDDLREQASAVVGSPADLVEWRADHAVAAGADLPALIAAAGALREIIAPVPLLLTIRTRHENGAADLDGPAYAALLEALIAADAADAYDVEMLWDEQASRAVVAAAALAGRPVIGSHHDFSGTPDRSRMVAALARIAELGADVAKLAVMPATPQDVLGLLAATVQAREELDVPLITMSMGSLGAISRLSGAWLGSSATFGSLGEASAPGQLPAAQLDAILDALGAPAAP